MSEDARRQKNIFNLQELISSSKTSSEPYKFRGSDSYSDSQIAELLIGYEYVSKEDRGMMTPNIHVRYKKENGDFKRGGYVVRNYISHKPDTKGHRMLRLKSSLGPGSKEWTINLENISDLWKTTKFQPKPSVESISGELQNTTDGLKNRLEQLTIEVSRISNEQKRIIALIKKLHNINI